MMLQKIRECVEERRLMRSLGEKGQGIVEYALILAFVVVIAMALTNSGGLQDKIKAVFTSVGNEVDKAGSNTSNAPTNP